MGAASFSDNADEHLVSWLSIIPWCSSRSSDKGTSLFPFLLSFFDSLPLCLMDLLTATLLRDSKRVNRLLRNPQLNVNWGTDAGRTALHSACHYGYDEIVTVLLAHPLINVNQRDGNGFTGFLLACSTGRITTLWLLLQDSRVEITNGDEAANLNLCLSLQVRVEVAELVMLLRTEKLLALMAEWRREKKRIPAGRPMARFERNPLQVCHDVGVKWNVEKFMVAELYAMVVFTCDGLLALKSPKHTRKIKNWKRTKFLKIAQQLPMELQMLMCNRVYSMARDGVPLKESEAAFHSLGIRYSPQPPDLTAFEIVEPSSPPRFPPRFPPRRKYRQHPKWMDAARLIWLVVVCNIVILFWMMWA